MKKIIKDWGWPTISKFGGESAGQAWLLVQHADHDVDFQEKCLGLMTPLLAKAEVKKSNYAYLWDRTKVNRGKPQRYGSQGICKGKGKWEPRPVEDEKNLDTLRAQMDLGPMKDYVATISKICP